MRSACVASSSTGACSFEAGSQGRCRLLDPALGRGRGCGAPDPQAAGRMTAVELTQRVEAHVRRNDLIKPGGDVVCFVSGGADSTCLYHVLSQLGYRVSGLHVDHGLASAESATDAEAALGRFGAQGVQDDAGRIT